MQVKHSLTFHDITLERSQALRAADAEKRKIAKWLEKFQENGFEILVCTAKFSNGEAIYSRATPKTYTRKENYNDIKGK